MNTYRFETTTTMKPYNRNKYWIMDDIIRPINVNAENLKTALKLYRERVENRDYIDISENAIKHPEPMFRDTAEGDFIQAGYIITGKTLIENRSDNISTEQYIELWVDVSLLCPVDFEEV